MVVATAAATPMLYILVVAIQRHYAAASWYQAAAAAGNGSENENEAKEISSEKRTQFQILPPQNKNANIFSLLYYSSYQAS